MSDPHNPFVAPSGASASTKPAPTVSSVSTSSLLAARAGSARPGAPAPAPSLSARPLGQTVGASSASVSKSLVDALRPPPTVSSASAPVGAPAPAAGTSPRRAGSLVSYPPLVSPPPGALSLDDESDGGLSIKGAMPIFRDVEAVLHSPLGGAGVQGALSATTYALVFKPHPPLSPAFRHLPPSYWCLPFATIRKVDKVAPAKAGAAGAPLLELQTKDVRTLILGFRDEATSEKMLGHIKMVAFPTKSEFLQAFAEGASAKPTPPGTLPVAFPGWDVYNPYREFERLGVLTLTTPAGTRPLFRVTEVNREYEYAPTYPAVLVVPDRVTDAALAVISPFRSKARIPALTWVHPVHKSTLWRCSQPKVGLNNNTCAPDEAFLAFIREANVYSRDPTAPLLVADCRPRANALANKAGGWGYEVYAGTTLEFVGMHNIHALRDSYK